MYQNIRRNVLVKGSKIDGIIQNALNEAISMDEIVVETPGTARSCTDIDPTDLDVVPDAIYTDSIYTSLDVVDPFVELDDNVFEDFWNDFSKDD